MSDAEPLKRYAVRWSPRARRDLDLATSNHLDYTGNAPRARKLYTGLESAAAALSELPQLHQVSEAESKLFGFEVRRVLNRLVQGSNVAHHLIFRIIESGDDGAQVVVLHVRHASRTPLSVDEAREILAQQ